MFGDIYRKKRVLVTGHSGFKGSYLSWWLSRLGAEVGGLALPPETDPNHLTLLGSELTFADSCWCDLRDEAGLGGAFDRFQPDIVFHLAAQPLVRRSYAEPAATFAVNVMGTVNVLEAIRRTHSVRAAVIVTSDKCYENRERREGYREDEAMGGHDPYSASKGCAELVTSSYRRAFFHDGRALVASGRAGNVIGGGDWAADRLVPDLVRAAVSGTPAIIRNPDAVRPWQHVLEPLAGYLELGRKLLEGQAEFADGWNFGPGEESATTVGEAAETLHRVWDRFVFAIDPSAEAPHEAKLLRLDCAKARRKLNWHGVWDSRTAFEVTGQWYRNYYQTGTVNTAQDLATYVAAAEKAGLSWTK